MTVLGRQELLDRLKAAALRRGGDLQVLIVVDVWRFDDMNARLGVECCDAVLDALGAALMSGAGRCAAVGRIDGDEFGVVCAVPSEAAALKLARRLVELASQPVEVDGRLALPSVRAGVTVVAHCPDAVSESLRRAHAALEEAKRASAPVPVMYRNGCAAERRAWIGQALGDAFASREIELAYQPIAALPGGTIVGFEALLRWRTTQGVDVGPAEFVPVAEELGLILPIGRWALDRAVAVAAAMSRHRRPCMAVNLSPRQLETTEILSQIEDALCAHGLDAAHLALELTESELVDNPRAISVLRSVRRLGCRIGMDDFGTGYSCLRSLEMLPLDFIKLDRSFISRLGQDPRSERIVRATVSLADDLGLDTIAEGVETEAQYHLVAEVGCTHLQGNFVGRPAFDIEWPDGCG